MATRGGLVVAIMQGLWPMAWGRAQARDVQVSEPDTSRLQVEVHGLRSSAGAVRVAIWAGPQGFLREPARAVWADRATIVAGTACITSPAVPQGCYAVAVYHDENDNGRLDTTWFGAPKEGIGFSNNVFHRFYAPTFAECALDVQPRQSARVRIAIVY